MHGNFFKLLGSDETSILVGARNVVYNITLPSLKENINQVSINVTSILQCSNFWWPLLPPIALVTAWYLHRPIWLRRPTRLRSFSMWNITWISNGAIDYTSKTFVYLCTRYNELISRWDIQHIFSLRYTMVLLIMI